MPDGLSFDTSRDIHESHRDDNKLTVDIFFRPILRGSGFLGRNNIANIEIQSLPASDNTVPRKFL